MSDGSHCLIKLMTRVWRSKRERNRKRESKRRVRLESDSPLNDEEKEESKSVVVVVERMDWRVSLMLDRRLPDALAMPRKVVDRRPWLWPCEEAVVAIFYL